MLEQSILQLVGWFNEIVGICKEQIIQFVMTVLNCRATYTEILRTGEIRSSARGENIVVNFKANLCGDILVIIEPPNPTGWPVTDVTKLVLTDKSINQQKKQAIDTLRQKFRGLVFLPKMVAGLASVGFSFFVYLKSANILALLNSEIDFTDARKVFSIILMLTGFIFSRFIGFKIISVFLRLIKFFRKIWVWVHLIHR